MEGYKCHQRAAGMAPQQTRAPRERQPGSQVLNRQTRGVVLSCKQGLGGVSRIFGTAHGGLSGRHFCDRLSASLDTLCSLKRSVLRRHQSHSHPRR